MKAVERHAAAIKRQLSGLLWDIENKRRTFTIRTIKWQTSEKGDAYLYGIEQMEEAREHLKEALEILTTEPH